MNSGNLDDLNNDEKTKTITNILNNNGCQTSSSQNGLLKQLMAVSGDSLKLTSNCSLSSNATELNDSINEIESISSDLKSSSSSSLKLDSNESANSNKHRMFHSITSLIQSGGPANISATPAFSSISNNMMQQQYFFHHHQQQLQQAKSSPNIDSIKENMSALKSLLANTIYSSTPEQLYLQMPPFGSHQHGSHVPPSQPQLQQQHSHHHLQFENKTIDFKTLYENLSDEKRQQLMMSHQQNSFLMNNLNNASPTQIKNDELSYHLNTSNKRQLALSPNTNIQQQNKKKDSSNLTTNKTVSPIELDVNKLIESSKSNPQLDMVLSNLAAMAGTFLHHQTNQNAIGVSSFSPTKTEQTIVISNNNNNISNNNLNNQKGLLIKDETNKTTNKKSTEANNNDLILNETKNNFN